MFARSILAALDACAPLATPEYSVSGEASLPSIFDVSGLAAASIGGVCAEAAALLNDTRTVEIDRHLAGEWFTFFIEPEGWSLPPVWDPIAGIYATSDGFIRLHTNAPDHKGAALSVLQCEPTRDAVERVVSQWDGDALEAAIIAQDGCAAKLRSAKAWAAHPQGRAVADEPLIAWTKTDTTPPKAKSLSDIKILDLTRVLAGPVATRTLAGFGAHVLRIDPPGWGEAICEPEVTWGKRLATLDLKTHAGRDTFLRLLAEADVLVHGYRADALDGLGLGADVRRAANPALIDVAHNAYGWTGPWAQRRGFDSIVQMSCGIAHAGQEASRAVGPVPLPVQALDYGTGYLIAAAVLRALRVRAKTGAVFQARLSLARTAHLLMQSTGPGLGHPRAPRTDQDFDPHPKASHWGDVRTLRWPGPAPMDWSLPARPFHSDRAAWSNPNRIDRP